MKKLLYLAAIVLLIAGVNACGSEGAGSAAGGGDLVSALDSMSYGVGAYFGQQFKSQGLTLNGNQFGEGYTSGNAGNDLDPSYQSVFISYQQSMQTRQGQPYTESEPAPFSTDSLSYYIGYDFGRQMHSAEMEVNGNAFQQGCVDFMAGASKIDDAGVQAQVATFSTQMREKQQAVMAKSAVENKEKGKTFIAEKAQEEGVQSTESGLHYKVLEKGSGASPQTTDRVKVHYEGRLIDGTIFDSSYKRGTPAEFALNQVISGWTEGLQLMQPNSKYQFYIPSDLAYGDTGSPPNIGPGETLIFDRGASGSEEVIAVVEYASASTVAVSLRGTATVPLFSQRPHKRPARQTETE